MNKYTIDYEHGVAEFYTEATDDQVVIREFLRCAYACFGIRKSVGDRKIKQRYQNVELPIPYRDKGATHFLSHHEDHILFNANITDSDGDPWKLFNEHGDWCSCKELGKEELACSVHHFWVPDHDKICQCLKKDGVN